MKANIILTAAAALLLAACHHHPGEKQHAGESATHAEETHIGEIVFPSAKAEAVGVKVGEVQPRPFREVIRTSGQILPAPDSEVTVSATIGGIVSFPPCMTEGMPVSKGATVATLSSAGMEGGAPAERAKVAYETALRNYQRAQKLLNEQIISQKEYNDLRAAYENARIAYQSVAVGSTGNGQAVASPIDGYVKQCLVREGDYAAAGQALMTVTSTRQLRLRADVPAKYYPRLHGITSARFETPYDHRVHSLDILNEQHVAYARTVDTETSFYLPVTFSFNNREDILPGSYATVYLLGEIEDNAIAVPRSALTEEQGTYFVYIQLDDNCYRKQEVTLGPTNGIETRILRGLHPGDRIVTQGAYHVKLAGATSAIPAHSHEH